MMLECWASTSCILHRGLSSVLPIHDTNARKRRAHAHSDLTCIQGIGWALMLKAESITVEERRAITGLV
eukprot:6199111-Pleurochrysis_carterae.AAC.2